jgi:hypothetical protein
LLGFEEILSDEGDGEAGAWVEVVFVEVSGLLVSPLSGDVPGVVAEAAGEGSRDGGGWDGELDLVEASMGISGDSLGSTEGNDVGIEVRDLSEGGLDKGSGEDDFATGEATASVIGDGHFKSE